MRSEQNSASTTVPKLGISRGMSLRLGTVRAAHRGKRLIENTRLRSKLSCKDSRWLQIS